MTIAVNTECTNSYEFFSLSYVSSPVMEIYSHESSTEVRLQNHPVGLPAGTQLTTLRSPGKIQGWVTTLLALTRFNVCGQSLIFTTPASALAYHRKLLQAHSSGGTPLSHFCRRNTSDGMEISALRELPTPSASLRGRLPLGATRVVQPQDLLLTEKEVQPLRAKPVRGWAPLGPQPRL